MNILTYPARPINGGDLTLAPPKRGTWFYEPKLNGWRTLVHTPTGTMFNRQGKRLSIADEFGCALAQLFQLVATYEWLDWLDCEALERRHGIGRGTLIVLDTPRNRATYESRRGVITSIFREASILPQVMPADSVLAVPSYRSTGTLWEELQRLNKSVGAPFYEGLVAKRADSLYPIQLRSSTEEFAGWVKHRWAF